MIVSTDIGGTDFDDYQSLVHLLLFADVLDIEGLISSPWGEMRNRKQEILKVIDCYAQDYASLRGHSSDYPSPDSLRALSKQGRLDSAPPSGFDAATEGSEWIVRCARRDDPRPLWVLIWGGIDDLAQALHDAPDILPKLRVYYIGGPNKKWATSAYQYIADHHRALFIIENNASYRGWFVGGDQSGECDGRTFIQHRLKGRGAMGEFFCRYGDAEFKMGDTPSVAYLLGPQPEDPTVDSKGGGTFVRAWPRPHHVFRRLTTQEDVVEVFGMLEICLRPAESVVMATAASLSVDGQLFPGFAAADGAWHFRFVPKEVKAWNYVIVSDASALDGLTGGFTSCLPAPSRVDETAADLPHWWVDDPDPALAEGPHHGARTINRWRAEWLGAFARRAARLPVRR
ncbi:nucleoside hydrolase-like domain-containing protein [Uliginosibacterium sp. H1]|uniref:nucleoside hydrolase-like domain-containing protein n=1 Tax=Uliginosibacterium sp. H1 TaxID=3114757 RepID=UPI002E17F3AD|nr:nucleoside hydrolase-like domain-containing protein [Uliginosibacterium sp. H1]